MKLKLNLNTSNPNYDTSKGEQIAINVDGSDAASKIAADKTFPSGVMDTQVRDDNIFSTKNIISRL